MKTGSCMLLGQFSVQTEQPFPKTRENLLLPGHLHLYFGLWCSVLHQGHACTLPGYIHLQKLLEINQTQGTEHGAVRHKPERLRETDTTSGSPCTCFFFFFWLGNTRKQGFLDLNGLALLQVLSTFKACPLLCIYCSINISLAQEKGSPQCNAFLSPSSFLVSRTMLRHELPRADPKPSDCCQLPVTAVTMSKGITCYNF